MLALVVESLAVVEQDERPVGIERHGSGVAAGERADARAAGLPRMGERRQQVRLAAARRPQRR